MATVGHAYLKIMPSLQGLGRHLRDQVREAESGAPSISLTAQVQTALLKEQLRAAAREGDQTAINLLADLDALPAETRFQRLIRQLSGQSVSIRVLADKSLGATVRGLGELNSGLTSSTAQFTRMTLAVGASVLKYGAMAAAIGQAVALLGGLGGVAATASGSLLLVPAAGLAAAAAIGTLKLGVAGFSDALKESDPAKYAEALKDFAPSMAAAANAARALRPLLAGVRHEVQERLFANLAADITGLAGTYLPLLRTELGKVAAGLNLGAAGFASFARDGRTVSDITSILDNSAVSISNLSAGVAPFLQGLRDIAAVGAEFLPGFGSGLADGAQKFADFIAAARESGQLQQWLSAGLSAVGDLVTVLTNLAKVVGAVFSAASTGGAGLLTSLVEITGQMAAFVQSAEGAGALAQIFGGLRAVTAGLLPILTAIGQAIITSIAPAIAQLGPMIGAAFATLAPAIAPLGQIIASLAPILGLAAQALVSVLVPAVAALAPIVAALAPVIGQVVGLLGGALGAAITAITPALVGLAQTLAPLIEGFGGLLVQALQLVAPVIAALTPFIAQIGGALLQVLRAVMPVLSALAGIFTSVLLAALNAVMPVLPVIVAVIQQLARVIGSALAVAAPVLTEVAGLLGRIAGQVVAGLLPILPPLAAAFLSIVTALLPILPPILQLVSALLPPLLGLITSLLPTIVQAAGLFASLVSAIAPLITQIAQFLIPIIQALFDVVQPIFAAIMAVISGAMQYIRGVIDVVLGLISGDWGRVWSGLKNMLGGIWAAISVVVADGIGGLLGFFVSLPGRILGALGNLGGLLLDAGKNIIRGLVDGISAGFGWVKDKLGQLTGWITSWKGPPARDKILLTGNGRLIMNGLLAGLRDGEPQIRDYLTGLTDALPLDVTGTVNATGTAPASRAVIAARGAAAVPTTGEFAPSSVDSGRGGVTVVIDGTGLPRALAEWLRHAVRTEGGGSVQAAFGR